MNLKMKILWYFSIPWLYSMPKQQKTFISQLRKGKLYLKRHLMNLRIKVRQFERQGIEQEQIQRFKQSNQLIKVLSRFSYDSSRPLFYQHLFHQHPPSLNRWLIQQSTCRNDKIIEQEKKKNFWVQLVNSCLKQNILTYAACFCEINENK